MAMAGDMGCRIDASGDAAFWFGEDQSRYVISTPQPEAFNAQARKAGVSLTKLGETGGKDFILNKKSASVSSLKEANDRWLPEYMELQSGT
jgi:phosphoribosylformylglycinamidine (FGAM) synthase-like enzyme